MARARVPMEKRELEGTVRAKHRAKAKDAPKVPVKTLVECPQLSKNAKKHWPLFVKMFKDLPIFCESDIGTVQRMVECYAEIREYMEVLEEEDKFYESYTKQGKIIRAHPAVAALAEADRRFRAYMMDCGMSPASRSRVKGESDGDGPQDPLKEFL